MSFIRLENVVKEYESAYALRGVSMEVGKREWVSVMGRSGSGKSTLLNIIGGLDEPSGGEVFVDSENISGFSETAMARYRRERTGFVTQRAHLVPYLSAVENVMLAQYFHSVADEAEAVEALKRVGLGQRLNHRPSQLSGGEQQRICIARALINSPELLLADEPTGNLDTENTKVVLELLKKLHSEEHFTIVLVTHDPFVSEWGERTLTLEDGKLKSDVRG